MSKMDDKLRRRANELRELLGFERGDKDAWKHCVGVAKEHQDKSDDEWSEVTTAILEDATKPENDDSKPAEEKESVADLVEEESEEETEDEESEDMQEGEIDLGEAEPIAEIPASDRVVSRSHNAPSSYVPEFDDLDRVKDKLHICGLEALDYAGKLEGPVLARAAQLAANYYFLRAHGPEGVVAEKDGLTASQMAAQKQAAPDFKALRKELYDAMFHPTTMQDKEHEEAIRIAANDNAIKKLLDTMTSMAFLFQGSEKPYELCEPEFGCYNTTQPPGLGLYWFMSRSGAPIYDQEKLDKLMQGKQKPYQALGADFLATKPQIKDPTGTEYITNPVAIDGKGNAVPIERRIRQLTTGQVNTFYKMYFENGIQSRTGGLKVAPSTPGSEAPSADAEKVIKGIKALSGKDLVAASGVLADRVNKDQKAEVVKAFMESNIDPLKAITSVLPALCKAAEDGKLTHVKPTQMYEAARFFYAIAGDTETHVYLDSIEKNSNPQGYQVQVYNMFVDLRDAMHELMGNRNKIENKRDAA